MLKENIENRIINLLGKYEFRFRKLSNFLGCKSKNDKLYLENVLQKMQLQGLIYYNEGIYQLFPKKFVITTIEEMNHKKEGHTACFQNAKNGLVPIKEQDLRNILLNAIKLKTDDEASSLNQILDKIDEVKLE